MYRDLDMLDAADLLADDVNQLLDAPFAISFTEHSCTLDVRNRLVTIDKMLVRLQRSRLAEPAAAIAADNPPRRTTRSRR